MQIRPGPARGPRHRLWLDVGRPRPGAGREAGTELGTRLGSSDAWVSGPREPYRDERRGDATEAVFLKLALSKGRSQTTEGTGQVDRGQKVQELECPAEEGLLGSVGRGESQKVPVMTDGETGWR